MSTANTPDDPDSLLSGEDLADAELIDAELTDDDAVDVDPDRMARARAKDEAAETDLQDMLTSPVFTGGDPEIIEQVRASSDPVVVPEDPTLAGQLHQVTAEILDRTPEHKIGPTLDRVNQVMDLLGNPQHTYPVIQITGTNGKSSMARMIDALCSEKGLRTGRFTSPHLDDVRERISLHGEPISAEDFVATWRDVEPYVRMIDDSSLAAGGPRLSFFEVLTVMAYAAFADAPVDVAIIEVGLGGTWDATNVADADIAVIGPIDRDHTAWLGTDLNDIAGEKAGIITSRSSVVVAEQDDQADGVVLARAAEQGARVIHEGNDMEVLDRTLAVDGQTLVLSTPGGVYQGVYLPLHGRHQAHNALLALVAAETFFGGAALDGGVVEKALGEVKSPGRIEVVRPSPTVVVDAAHNPAGARALRHAIGEAFTFERLVGVVGMMRDKAVEAVLSELEPFLDDVVITNVGTDRGMETDELAPIAEDVFGPDRVRVEPNLDNALDVAATLAESELTDVVTRTGVLVTGSVVLAGRVRTMVGRRGTDPEG